MGSRKSRDLCACGKLSASNGIINGKRTFKRACWRCIAEKRERKKSYCEACGFVAKWHGQLDVDHIDGNHHNGDASNLQTLCVNCHRLKTHRSSDNLNPGRIGTSNSDVLSKGNMINDSPVGADAEIRRCGCGNKSRPNGITCWSCRSYKHRKHPKGDRCLLCGFKPEWAGQLDMDHVDGNRLNNDISNLQTLCANCHRLTDTRKAGLHKKEQARTITFQGCPAGT